MDAKFNKGWGLRNLIVCRRCLGSWGTILHDFLASPFPFGQHWRYDLMDIFSFMLGSWGCHHMSFPLQHLHVFKTSGWWTAGSRSSSSAERDRGNAESLARALYTTIMIPNFQLRYTGNCTACTSRTGSTHGCSGWSVDRGLQIVDLKEEPEGSLGFEDETNVEEGRWES
jgi:hypothetical protein